MKAWIEFDETALNVFNKNAYAGPHTAVAPSGHRRNLRFSSMPLPGRHGNTYKNAYAGPHTAVAPSGHRRNLPFSSSAETVILAVLAVVPIKLVGPNTAVFGIMSISLSE